MNFTIMCGKISRQTLYIPNLWPVPLQNNKEHLDYKTKTFGEQGRAQ